MANSPTATFIVLHRRGLPPLTTTLTDLSAKIRGSDRLIVVDNGSYDDSVAEARHVFPQVMFMENELDLGDAGGFNSALGALESEIAVLVRPGAGKGNSADLHALPALQPELDMVTDSALITGLAEGAALGVTSQENAGLEQTTVMALRRTVWQQTGLLDEGFKRYFWDADIWSRAQRMGFRGSLEARQSAGSTTPDPTNSTQFDLRSYQRDRWRFILKYGQAWTMFDDVMRRENADISRLSAHARLALVWAYGETLADLGPIMAARLEHGGVALRPAEVLRLGQELLSLQKAALLWPTDDEQWAALLDEVRVEPQPFTSTTPLIGPLLARLRDAWAAVGTKAYVGALTVQQNDFNATFVRELEGLETRIRQAQKQWLRRDGDLRSIRLRARTLQHEIDETSRLLSAIEARLRSQEEQIQDTNNNQKESA